MNEVSTPGLIEDRDQRSGFDINGSSNGVPRLGGTVDFRTLVAGPAMDVISLSGLGASTTAAVSGVAKGTSGEGDVWVGIYLRWE